MDNTCQSIKKSQREYWKHKSKYWVYCRFQGTIIFQKVSKAIQLIFVKTMSEIEISVDGRVIVTILHIFHFHLKILIHKRNSSINNFYKNFIPRLYWYPFKYKVFINNLFFIYFELRNHFNAQMWFLFTNFKFG